MSKQLMNALLPSLVKDNVVGFAGSFDDDEDEQLQFNNVKFLVLGIKFLLKVDL
ncbi:hypothetical protein SOVF_214310 [Spinacia oleracea]|nr:hypothetical protein SOVF_214310 [Spinacia oleracea]